MAVLRFYVPAAAATHGLTPTPNASWNYTSERTQADLIRAKNASPTAITVGTQIGPWTATAGQTALDGQLISDPLDAQTISGTFSCMSMVREYNTADNVDRVVIGVYVINSSGTVVATLLSLGLQTGGATLEFVSNTTHRTHTGANAATLTGYTTTAGDRILIEYGYSNSTAAATPEASTKWGENATDATINDNATTANRAPWFEFSNGLVFLPPVVSSLSSATAQPSGGKTITINGSGFVNGATVTINGNSATSVSVTTSKTITCVVPIGTAGSVGNVVVTNPDSLAGTLVNGFTYLTALETEAVFLAAGGKQVTRYDAYSAATGIYSDTMGVGADFTQPVSGNRPTADTSISPAGRTMLGFAGNEVIGGDSLSPDGRIPTGALAAWASGMIFVEHWIVYLPSTPDNVTEQRVIDYDGSEYWIRNLGGAGLMYRGGANADAAMSGLTPYFVTQENRVTGATSTMTVQGATQSDTGSNSSAVRTLFVGPKAIGARPSLIDPFVGHMGCYGIGQATTWGSTERAALYAAMQQWFIGTRTGTLTKTLDDITLDAEGDVSGGSSDITGTLNVTLDNVTASGSGSSQISGQASINVDAVTLSGQGNVPAVGSLNKTLDDVSVTASGTAPATGTLNKTLDDITASAQGDAPIAGALNKTLDDIAASGAGSSPISGQASINVDNVTASAQGNAPIAGQASVTLDNVTLTAEGSSAQPGTGTLNVTLDNVTLDAEGNAPIAGALNKTLDDVSVTATGTAPATSGSLNATIDNVTLTAEGDAPISGQASVALDNVTTSAQGNAPIDGQASVTLDDVTIVAAGAGPANNATLNVTLDDVTASAQGDAPIAGQASIDLDNVTASGSGESPISARGDITIDDIAAIGEGKVPVTGQANITIGDITAGIPSTTAVIFATACGSISNIVALSQSLELLIDASEGLRATVAASVNEALSAEACESIARTVRNV